MRSRLSRITAILLIFGFLFSFSPGLVRAEEGMFLPNMLTKLPPDQLKRRGLKIPLTDIYNPWGVSIKDAVVIVGGGTGEFVSPEGLLLTNHHVAFDALVAASDEKNDYGTKGFTARSRTEELPATGYTVTITEQLKDVTTEVLSSVSASTSPSDRAAAIQNKVQALESSGSRPQDGIQVRVLPIGEGLQYYQFTYLILRDVRIVYAPPKAIGFFGGDPDNFEWPRHCGDFAFMRAYVGPNGKPANYSDKNIPFKPKKFLSLSLGGVYEGDFMMVMGYPGSTRRYRESYSVAYNQDIGQPFYVDLFSKQISVLQRMAEADPSSRVKLQSLLFDLSNNLKNFEGSVVAMRRAGIVEKKLAEEAAFTKWINQDPNRKAKYGEVLPSLAKAYDVLNASAQRDLLVQQLASMSGLSVAALALQLAAEKEKPETERDPAFVSAATQQRIQAQVSELYADRNVTLERELLVYLLGKAAALPPNQKIESLEKRFGHLSAAARIEAETEFARSLIESKRFTSAESLNALFGMSAAQLRELHEPLLEFAGELNGLLQQVRARTQEFNATVLKLRPVLLEGIGEMRGGIPYPDANRTLRFSYGEVKGYVPRESITYNAFTTLAGVVEKDTGREPFDVPDKLKELYRDRDFGIYAGPNNSAVPVDFLSTNDIIGGNSGSPILNGKGEQVGIIFDGNYEGLGNDFFYNESKGRAIAVDIRYVLFVTEKFGNAGQILKELDIKPR